MNNKVKLGDFTTSNTLKYTYITVLSVFKRNPKNGPFLLSMDSEVLKKFVGPYKRTPYFFKNRLAILSIKKQIWAQMGKKQMGKQ